MGHTRGAIRVKENSNGAYPQLITIRGRILAYIVESSRNKSANEDAIRIAALWNMAERLGLSTEEIDGRKIDNALYKLEELELMVGRGDLK